jgi:hypothetical protein
MSVITLSRQHGALGEVLGEHIGAETGYSIVSRSGIEERLLELAGRAVPEKVVGERAPGILERLTVDFRTWKGFLEESILDFPRRGNVLIVGRGAFKILRGIPGILHIFVTGEKSKRSKQVAESEGIPEMDAASEVEKSDRERAGFLQYYFGEVWPDPSSFHLSVNPLSMGLEKATGAAQAFMEKLNLAGDFDAEGKRELESRYALASGRNRVILTVGLEPDLFELVMEGENALGIKFFGVPSELREKSIAALGDLLEGYTVRHIT